MQKMKDKKELIKEYKMSPPKMGIFRITNKVNGKIYLIASKNLPATHNRFPFAFKDNNYFIRELQNDWNKYGDDAFVYDDLDVLEPGDDPKSDYTEELNTLLQLWLDKLQPYGDRGYHTKKQD
jgi:hypothetical protein